MRLILTGVALTIFVSVAASADDVPQLTSVYKSSGTQMITIDCEGPNEGQLVCHFTQVLLSPGEKDEVPSKREDKINEVLSQFSNEDSVARECSIFQTVHSALKSGELPENLDDVAAISDIEVFSHSLKEMRAKPKKALEDTIQSMGLLADMCKKPSHTTASKIVDLVADIESRTCKIWSNTYSHQFKKNAQGQWVSTEGPNGQCGVVYVSVLEQDSEYPLLWNYWTRKIVTNKDGGSELLIQCKDLDEDVQTYSWKNDENFFGCDYIKFGLF
ncbi:MAG: hypothetical protein RIM72_01435 [Alphaproteobacteria bacterium]